MVRMLLNSEGIGFTGKPETLFKIYNCPPFDPEVGGLHCSLYKGSVVAISSLIAWVFVFSLARLRH